MLCALRPLVLPSLLLGALEWWSRTAGQGSDAIAPPSAAVRSLAEALANGSVLDATAFTLVSAFAGLSIACVLALVLGSALGLSQRIAAMSFLTIEMTRPIPSVALIPLATLLWGFGFGMEIAIVTFASFWPLLILTQTAVRQIDRQLLETAQALQLSRPACFWKIVLPAMIPRLFVALRLGVAVAVVVAVTAEIAVNPHGMGYALMSAQQDLDPALMLAWLFWISLVGFIINACLLRSERAIARHMGAVS